MHAFLSKIFGRKKDEKKDEGTSPTALSPTQLLDGKFEAVSPTVSPSASKFLELDQTTGERDRGASTSKATTRPTSLDGKSSKLDTLPHLSLNFGETRTDGFLLDDEIQGLSDSLIGERRLNSLEALILIRSCSEAITAHGLETLGLMHPHWYSSSPEAQRKLISQFLHSQSVKNANDTATTPIDSAIETTRSMHDIAAVLRWGLRHLQLDGDSFGTDAGWYKAFLNAEATAEYPPKAFSEKLAPLIPSTHLELLTTTLELFSSLAAHSEANSISGSKLSKLFGIWLLTARQVEDKDDWFSFYARWERTGRQLEHLFLAHIRDTNEDQRMPVRLLDLVRKYPYTQGLSSPATDLQLLPRPRFSTPMYDALFVRIEIEFPPSSRKPKTRMPPLNLLADAFATKVTTGEYAELWTKITAASKNGESPSPLSNIFADETIRFLSLVPDSNKAKEIKSPAFSLVQSPSSPSARSFASVEADVQAATQGPSSHKKFATEPITPLTASAIGNNWEQFSSSGFLDSTPAIGPLVATLFDQDIEKTVPPEPSGALSRKSSRRVKTISRKSVDLSRTPPPKDVTYLPAPTEAGPNEINPVVRAARLEIIQFDEAFIDFWTDSLLDPIAAKWPTFIICKFKSTLVPSLTYGAPSEVDQSQKQLKWLVLEQVYTNAKPPPPIMLPTPDATPMTSPVEQVRAISPTPSTKRRFNFWSMSRSTSSTSTGSANGKKKATTGKVNEMGELVEEESAEQVKNKYVAQTSKDGSSKKVARVPVPPEDIGASSSVPIAAAAAAVATTAVAATAVAAVVAGTETAIFPEEDKTPTQEIVASAQEEVTTPEAATVDATKAVETDTQTGDLVAETISPPAAESELTDTPTAPPPATAAVAVASSAVEQPEVVLEVEEPPTAVHPVSTGTPAEETVPPITEDVSASPVVDVVAATSVVEVTQAEVAPPLVETEDVGAIEEQEAALAPVAEPEDVPIVSAVSVVEENPVIEDALPAPALEPENVASPVVETEAPVAVVEAEENGPLTTDAEGPADTADAGPVIDADDASSVPEDQPTSFTVKSDVAAPVEFETSTALSAPGEAEQMAIPVAEAELAPTDAAMAESKAPVSDIAEEAPSSDNVGISLAHVEVEAEASTEPPTALLANDDEATPSQLETEAISTVEPGVHPVDVAAEAGSVLASDGVSGVTELAAPAIVEAEPDVNRSLENEGTTAPIVTSLENEPTQVAEEVPVVPAVSDAAVLPSVMIAEASPAPDAEVSSSIVADTAVAHPAVDDIRPIVEEEGDVKVAGSPEAEVDVELATPSVAQGDEDASDLLQDVGTVTSTTEAELSVSATGTEGTLAGDNSALSTDTVPHVVAQEDSVPPIEDINDVPSAVEESVSPAVFNDSLLPPQGVVSVQEESAALADAAAEPMHAIVSPAKSEITPPVEPAEIEANAQAAEIEELTDRPEVVLEAEHDVLQPSANLHEATLASTVDSEVTPPAESSIDISGIESPSDNIQAPMPVDHVEMTHDPIPVRTEEQPVEHIAEVASIDAPVAEVEDEHVDEAPAALTGFLSAEDVSIAADKLDASPPPQIEEDRLAVDEPPTSEQADAAEESVIGVVEESTLDTSVKAAGGAEGLQAHPEVVGPEDHEGIQEDVLTQGEPVVESVPELTATNADDEPVPRSAEASASDPVLPPGLYPTAAQAESHSDISPASAPEAVPSHVEDVETEALTAAGEQVPPQTEEVVEGGAADDHHTSEIVSATPFDEFSTEKSTTAPGESISTFSPPSPSPNEVSAPTVMEQEAPDADVTTTALDGPALALTAGASEETGTMLTATAPAEGDDKIIAQVADPVLSSIGTETAATANDIDGISEVRAGAQIPEVVNSPALETAFVSPVPGASEPEVAVDTVEKDEGALVNAAELDTTASLSNDPEARVSELTDAEPVSEAISSERIDVGSERLAETGAVASLSEELAEQGRADGHPEVHLLNDASPTDIPTETHSVSEIVVSQPTENSVEEEPAAEIKDQATPEAAPDPIGQHDIAEDVHLVPSVAPEAVVEDVFASSQPLAEPETHEPVEVAEKEIVPATTQASAAEVLLAGEEPVVFDSEKEMIHDNAVEAAARDIPSDEAPASAPLSEESVDPEVEDPVFSSVPEASVPVESAVEEESVADPAPAVVLEDSPIDVASSQILDETAEPGHGVASEPTALAAEYELTTQHESPATSVEPAIAQTLNEALTEDVSQVREVASHVDEPASVVPESSVDDSVIAIPVDEPSFTPLAAAAEVEHAPEPIAAVAGPTEAVEAVDPAAPSKDPPREIDETPTIEEPSEAPLDVVPDAPSEPTEPVSAVADPVDTFEPTAPAEEASLDVVDETPAVEETALVQEPSEVTESAEHDAPATVPPVAVDEETAHPEHEVHSAVEDPVHPEAIALATNESPAPLENVATMPTGDPSAVVEDVDAPAQVTAVPVAPSVDSVVVEGEAREVVTHVDEPATAGELLVEDSTPYVPVDEPSAAPLATEAEVAHAAEPSEPDVAAVAEPVEAIEHAAAAEESSRDIIEVAPAIDEAVSIEEHAETHAEVEPEAPATVHIATGDDEEVPLQESQAAVDEPVHHGTSLIHAEESPAPLEDPAAVPAEDASAVVEDVDIPAQAADVPVEASVQSVVDEDVDVAPKADAEAEAETETESSSKPVESQAPAVVEAAPAEVVSDHQTIEDVSSGQEAAAAPIHVEAPAEPEAETISASDVVIGKVEGHSEAAHDDNLDEKPVTSLTNEISPAHGEVNDIAEAVAPTEDVSLFSDPPVQTVEEPAPVEAAKADEHDADAVTVDDAEPVEHEDVPVASAPADLDEPSDLSPTEPVDTEPQAQEAEPVEGPVVSVESVAPPQGVDASGDEVREVVEREQTIDKGEPAESPKQEDEAIEAPTEGLATPVDEALVAEIDRDAHDEPADVLTAVEVISLGVEHSPGDQPLEAAPEETVEAPPQTEVPIAAQHELGVTEKTPAPSDESILPIESSPGHVDEAAIANESVVYEAVEVASNSVEDIHAVEEPVISENIVSTTNQDEANPIDVSEDRPAEHEPLEKASDGSEEISPPTESEAHDAEAGEDVVDTEAEKPISAPTDVGDETATHGLPTESAVDAVEDEEGRPVLAERAPEETDVINQKHVYTDAITDVAAIADEEPEAERVQVADVLVEENPAQPSDDAEIPPPEDVSIHATEDSAEPVTDRILAEPTTELAGEDTTEGAPIDHRHAQVEETVPLSESLVAVSEAQSDAAPQIDDVVFDTVHAATEAPIVEEDAQRTIVDAPPLELEHVIPTAPAHESSATFKPSAPDVISIPTQETASEDASPLELLEAPAAEPVLEEPAAIATESVVDEEPDNEMPTEEAAEPTGAAAEPVDEAHTPSLEKGRDETQENEHVVKEDVDVFDEAHPPVAEAAVEGDDAATPAVLAAEPSDTTTPAVETETGATSSEALAVPDVEPVESELPEESPTKDDQEEHAHIELKQAVAEKAEDSDEPTLAASAPIDTTEAPAGSTPAPADVPTAVEITSTGAEHSPGDEPHEAALQEIVEAPPRTEVPIVAQEEHEVPSQELSLPIEFSPEHVDEAAIANESVVHVEAVDNAEDVHAVEEPSVSENLVSPAVQDEPKPTDISEDGPAEQEPLEKATDGPAEISPPTESEARDVEDGEVVADIEEKPVAVPVDPGDEGVTHDAHTQSAVDAEDDEQTDLVDQMHVHADAITDVADVADEGDLVQVADAPVEENTVQAPKEAEIHLSEEATVLTADGSEHQANEQAHAELTAAADDTSSGASADHQHQAEQTADSVPDAPEAQVHVAPQPEEAVDNIPNASTETPASREASQQLFDDTLPAEPAQDAPTAPAHESSTPPEPRSLEIGELPTQETTTEDAPVEEPIHAPATDLVEDPAAMVGESVVEDAPAQELHAEEVAETTDAAVVEPVDKAEAPSMEKGDETQESEPVLSDHVDALDEVHSVVAVAPVEEDAATPAVEPSESTMPAIEPASEAEAIAYEADAAADAEPPESETLEEPVPKDDEEHRQVVEVVEPTAAEEGQVGAPDVLAAAASVEPTPAPVAEDDAVGESSAVAESKALVAEHDDVSNEDHSHKADALVDEEAASTPAALLAEPSELTVHVVEPSPDAEMESSEVFAAPDAEPVESEIPEESTPKDGEEEHHHIAEAVEEVATEEVELEASHEPAASAPIGVTEEMATEPTSVPVVEHDAVGELSAVEQGAPAEVIAAPIAEDDVAPVEVLQQEHTIVEPDASVVENEDAPLEADAVPEADEVLATEHATKAQVVDVVEEEKSADEHTTAPVIEGEVPMPPTVSKDPATEVHTLPEEDDAESAPVTKDDEEEEHEGVVEVVEQSAADEPDVSASVDVAEPVAAGPSPAPVVEDATVTEPPKVEQDASAEVISTPVVEDEVPPVDTLPEERSAVEPNTSVVEDEVAPVENVASPEGDEEMATEHATEAHAVDAGVVIDAAPADGDLTEAPWSDAPILPTDEEKDADSEPTAASREEDGVHVPSTAADDVLAEVHTPVQEDDAQPTPVAEAVDSTNEEAPDTVSVDHGAAPSAEPAEATEAPLPETDAPSVDAEMALEPHAAPVEEDVEPPVAKEDLAAEVPSQANEVAADAAASIEPTAADGVVDSNTEQAAVPVDVGVPTDTGSTEASALVAEDDEHDEVTTERHEAATAVEAHPNPSEEDASVLVEPETEESATKESPIDAMLTHVVAESEVALGDAPSGPDSTPVTTEQVSEGEIVGASLAAGTVVDAAGAEAADIPSPQDAGEPTTATEEEDKAIPESAETHAEVHTTNAEGQIEEEAIAEPAEGSAAVEDQLKVVEQDAEPTVEAVSDDHDSTPTEPQVEEGTRDSIVEAPAMETPAESSESQAFAADADVAEAAHTEEDSAAESSTTPVAENQISPSEAAVVPDHVAEAEVVETDSADVVDLQQSNEASTPGPAATEGEEASEASVLAGETVEPIVVTEAVTVESHVAPVDEDEAGTAASAPETDVTTKAVEGLDDHAETTEDADPTPITETSEPAQEQSSLSEATSAEVVATDKHTHQSEASKALLAPDDEAGHEQTLAAETEVSAKAIPMPHEAEAGVEDEAVVDPPVDSVAQEEVPPSEDVVPANEPNVDEVPLTIPDTADPVQLERAAEPIDAPVTTEDKTSAASESLEPKTESDTTNESSASTTVDNEEASPEGASVVVPASGEVDLVSEDAAPAVERIHDEVTEEPTEDESTSLLEENTVVGTAPFSEAELDAPTERDSSPSERVNEDKAAAELVDEHTGPKEPLTDDLSVDTSTHEPVTVATTAIADSDKAPEAFGAVIPVEEAAEAAAPTAAPSDEAHHGIPENAHAIDGHAANEEEASGAKTEAHPHIAAVDTGDKLPLLNEQDSIPAEQTEHPIITAHSEAAAPLQNVPAPDITEIVEDAETLVEAEIMPVAPSSESIEVGATEEPVVDNTIDTSVAEPVIDGAAALDAEPESEHLNGRSESLKVPEEASTRDEPQAENPSPEAEAAPIVDEVEPPEVEDEAVPETVSHGDSSFQPLVDESDLIENGNGNGHHAEPDKFDAGLDKSESVALPDDQEAINEETSFATAAVNGNGHVKTETDVTLVEPISAPIVADDDKLDAFIAQDEAVTSEGAPLLTVPVLDKVEELLASAGAAIDPESIDKSNPLLSVHHDDDTATKFTTTAVDDGDEEQ